MPTVSRVECPRAGTQRKGTEHRLLHGLPRAPLRILTSSLLALALVAAACGGDDDDGSDPTPTVAPTAAATATASPSATPPPPTDGRVARDGDAVQVHYHGTLANGEVFDSSREREPFEFVVGAGQVIAGFDDAVRGLAVGESITVTLPPEQAYGQRRDDLIVELDAAGAPDGLRVGDRVRLANGAPATVLAISEDIVQVDANHALAGETLTFEIELIEIR